MNDSCSISHSSDRSSDWFELEEVNRGFFCGDLWCDLMAGKSHPKKPLEDMMNNLKVETSSEFCNGNANSATPKEGSPSDTTSCISLAGDATSSFKESDVEQEALIAEQGMYYPASGYYGYYYPGFDGSFSEWDGHQCHVTGAHGLDAQYPAFQEDNGSIVYYTPGLQVGYSAFPPYAPGTVIGMDGQFMGQQPFLPSSTFPQPLTSPGYLTSPVPYSMEGVPTYPWEVFPVFGDGTHGNSFGGISTVTSPNMAPPKTNFSTAKTTNISKPKTLEKQSLPLLDIPRTNISIKHANKVSQNGSNFPAAALAKGYFPLQKLPGKSSLYYPNNAGHVKSNGRGFIGPENIKGRSEMDGLNHFDLLNEQNRGPRITGAKTNLGSAFDTSISDSNGHGSIIRRDQYNLSDFRTEYDEALFYVIKSYSEDDIHKSIKYSGWASTSNGNKRLDNAYQAAHKKMEDKGSKCPIFLFFSVNASGQFCGVAEMIGHVDFDKNMDFWQQDKWNGFFPVKWHIIKDVPNPQFRHIRLENNDNKPVTNSRDTQEVKLPLGIEMLNIFKNYLAKTSILDDFEFYENRQKAMQDKRVRPLVPQFEYLQKKPDDVVQVVKAGKLIPTVLNQLPADFASVNKSTEENQVPTEAK